MGRRGLDIVLISAEFLTRQYPGNRMVVQAKANITKDSAPVKYTKADSVGDVNPTWNHRLHFTLHCSNGGTTSPEFLNIDLCNTVPDGSSCVIGSSQIPLVNFLASAGKEAMAPVDNSWPVNTGGRLYFSYKLGAYDSTVAKIAKDVWHATLESFIDNEINDDN